MEVPSSDNLSVRKCNKICKYKDREIDFEKILYLRITTKPVGITSKNKTILK